MKLSEMKVEKTQPLKKQDLRPPKTVSKPTIQKIEPIQDFDSYFENISKSSEFKRLVYLIYTGKTHRGTTKNLDVELKSHKTDIDIVKGLGRGSHQDFKEVVNELKEALAKRKAKIEVLP